MLILLALACSSDRLHAGGTGVGNPGTTRLSMARSDEVTVDEATVELAAFTVARCEGGADTVEVGDLVDLLAPEPYDLPGGGWCGLRVALDAPLRISGAAEDGDRGKGTFEVDLDLRDVGVDLDELLVDGGSYVLELRPPSKDALGGLEDGTHTTVAPGRPEHADLAAEVRRGVALWEDEDGDGEIGDDEREPGPLGGDPGRDDEDDD